MPRIGGEPKKVLLPAEGKAHGRPVTHAGSGGSPCPAGREPLFPRSGHPALTRARAIHGALAATPGRQGPAHPGVGIDASVADKEAVRTNRRRGVPTGRSEAPTA